MRGPSGGEEVKSGCEARKLEDMVFDTDTWRSRIRASGDIREIALGKEQTYTDLMSQEQEVCCCLRC